MKHNCKNFNTRILFVVILAAALLIVGFAGALAQMGDHKTPSTHVVHASQLPSPQQSVEQIVSARDVAGRIGCNRFKDTGPAAAGIVLDSGRCWMSHRTFGIDTFATPEAMRLWMKTARKFGVRPLYTVGTAVVYPSVN